VTKIVWGEKGRLEAEGECGSRLGGWLLVYRFEPVKSDQGRKMLRLALISKSCILAKKPWKESELILVSYTIVSSPAEQLLSYLIPLVIPPILALFQRAFFQLLQQLVILAKEIDQLLSQLL
jgi:hypothetical protein